MYIPSEYMKVYSDNNIHEIRLRNEYFRALNIFWKIFQNDITFLRSRISQNELHRSVRQGQLY